MDFMDFMDSQAQFEEMITSQNPSADLTREEGDTQTYSDPGTQVAWCGFQALTRSSQVAQPPAVP